MEVEVGSRNARALRPTSSSGRASTASRPPRAWPTAFGRKDQRPLALDKVVLGAGALGIACGVVRNNYFESGDAQRSTAHPVSAWDSDLKAFF